MSEECKLESYGFKEVSPVCEICAGNIVDEPVKFLFKDNGLQLVHLKCYMENTPDQIVNKMSKAKEKIKSMKTALEAIEGVSN